MQKIHFFAFLYQRVDNVNLPSFCNLLSHKAEYSEPLVFEEMHGLNRLSTSRELVDQGDVQISIHGHRQCSGNRCGGHHQHMWRNCVFSPKLGSLFHTKTVLLVNDHKSNVFEFDLVLDQRVGSD